MYILIRLSIYLPFLSVYLSLSFFFIFLSFRTYYANYFQLLINLKKNKWGNLSTQVKIAKKRVYLDKTNWFANSQKHVLLQLFRNATSFTTQSTFFLLKFFFYQFLFVITDSLFINLSPFYQSILVCFCLYLSFYCMYLIYHVYG